ncbi:auxin efflux carrier [Linnemannia elongata]|nr:auxin efflux carrier [Linnemannia elongata]
MVALSTLIWTSAKPIIKFVVLGGCGAIMAKHGLLTPAGAKVVAGLILNYTLPALLFAKMLACVNQDNAEELVLVALVAVGIMLMGGFLGLLIQRTGLIPKRLHWGIVAATMFTNFGDLPISIILAVSDHPPFLVGDGARGTAYSSVFIAVFYLFLFPFGGYKLIRIDHVKESKRLANLTTALRNHENNNTVSCEGNGNPASSGPSAAVSPSVSEVTLANGSGHSSPLQRQHSSSPHQDLTLKNPPHQRHLSSPRQHHVRQDQGGLHSSFSATSTMISMDYNMEENAKELRYRPSEPLQGTGHGHEPSSPSLDSAASPTTSAHSPLRETHSASTNPFARMNQDPVGTQQPTSPGAGNEGSNNGQTSPMIVHPPYPLHALKSSELQYQHQHRYSVESMASNGTGATRFSTSHEDDHNSLIHPPAPAMGKGGLSSSASRKKLIRPTLFRGYQPPPLNQQQQQQLSQQNSPTTPSSLGNMSRSGSQSPFISLTPPGTSGDGSTTAPAGVTGSGFKRRGSGAGAVGDRVDPMADVPFEMVTLGATRGGPSSSSSLTTGGRSNTSMGSSTTAAVSDIAATQDPAPLPKVPPQLQKSYESKKKLQQTQRQEKQWFWRFFHSTREYLTPPTIGLLLGLLCALTPLRGLFVVTPNPLPSPDELPPLSFIYEITLMLGGCCVPLGLTVLGASLSRLKPGRMRPLIPALTMITIAKMVISPLVGVLFVELVLVRHFQWVSAQNHMLQFTLMLMSGSPTSMICFVLAQVWDRRTTNAGSEMAAVIAVQYAVGTVLITLGSAFMMYFLF